MPRRAVAVCIAGAALWGCGARSRLQDGGTQGGGQLASSASAGGASSSTPNSAANVSSSSSGSGASGEWAKVGAGGEHTCAIKTDSTLWCWGYNYYGQLGDGTYVDRHTPVQVTTLGANVVEVATGTQYTCALTADGALWCFGDSEEGELGDGKNVYSHTPVRVKALGNSVAEISARRYHSCARETNGAVSCWGWNALGELGDGTTISRNTPVPITALGNGVAGITAGDSHTCARKADGTLWCWGSNGGGEIGDGTTVDRHEPTRVSAVESDVAAVAAFVDTCAIKMDGTLWCWGPNAVDKLSHPAPAQVSALGSGVTDIAAGPTDCAIKTDGTLWCWGSNGTGELGNGTSDDQPHPAPVQVNALGAGVAEVARGLYHTCAIKTDGTLWCWGGDNRNGALGDGTTVPKHAPVQVK